MKERGIHLTLVFALVFALALLLGRAACGETPVPPAGTGETFTVTFPQPGRYKITARSASGAQKVMYVTAGNQDTDGDGLPDWWEAQYGFSLGEDNSANLMGWWELEETNGPTVQDSSGHGNNGTAVNMSPWPSVPGYPGGRALDFDGSDDYAVVPHSDSLMPTSAVTVAAWVYLDSWGPNNFPTIVSKKTDYSTVSYTLMGMPNGGGDGLMLFFIGSFETHATAAMPTGRWTHVAGVYNGTNISVYINGVQGTPTPYTGGIPFNTSEVTIGYFGIYLSDPPDLLFDGRMDDIRIYGTALSASAIANIVENAADADHDGISNAEEFPYGTNPRNPDTDGDDMPDGWEVANGFSPLDPVDAAQDADSDALSNLEEYQLGTHPRNSDSDEDDMPDGWEVANGFNPLDPADGAQDADSDGLSNGQEYVLGTDLFNPDSDADGLTDGEEVAAGSDPNDPNSPAPRGARTRYVSPTGGHVAPFRTWAKAATNIQSAVDAADAGDTVLVGDGVYGTGSRTSGGILGNRVAIPDAITVESVNGPEYTTILGRAAGQSIDIRCAYMGGGARLNGFTLTGGWTGISGDYEKDQSGGGVWCEPDAVVSNCVIRDNWAPNHGGGAYRGTYMDCVFAGNTGGSGGAAANATLNGCLVSNNMAFTFGGGGAYGCTILDSRVVDNTATWAGGGMQGGTARNSIFMGNSAFQTYGSEGWGGGAAYGGMVENCVVVGNASAYGGGVAGGTVRNCIVYYNQATLAGDNYWNSTMSYCSTYPAAAGTGNITNDPQFVDLQNGNFHLLPSSPCINAGTNLAWMTNALDMEGNARILNGRVDIGAYEMENATALYATFLQGTTARFVVTGLPAHRTIQYRWVETGSYAPVDHGWMPLSDTNIVLQDVTPTWSHNLAIVMLEGTNHVTLADISWHQRKDTTTYLLFPRIDAPISTNGGGEVLASTTLMLENNVTGQDHFYLSGSPDAEDGGGWSLPEGFKIVVEYWGSDHVLARGPVLFPAALDVSASLQVPSLGPYPKTFKLMTTNGGDPGPFYLIWFSPVGIDEATAHTAGYERDCWDPNLSDFLTVHAKLGPSWGHGPLTISASGFGTLDDVMDQAAGEFDWSQGIVGAPTHVYLTWMWMESMMWNSVTIEVAIGPQVRRHVSISPTKKTAYVGGPETNVAFTANDPPGATNWVLTGSGPATMVRYSSTGAVVSIGTDVGSYTIGAKCALHPTISAEATLTVKPPLLQEIDYYTAGMPSYTNMSDRLYLEPGASLDFRAIPVVPNMLTLTWPYQWGGAAAGGVGPDVLGVAFPTPGSSTVSVEGGNALSNYVEVVKVDILESETNAGSQETSAVLKLTADSYWGPAGVSWTSEPEGLRGVGFNNSNFWFNPSLSDLTNTYTVTAAANGLPTCYDTCIVRFLKVEFVVPDDGDQPVQSDYLAVSDPRPVVTLDEIDVGDVTVSGNQATLHLSGVIEDAIVDNMPPGFGEIASVTVYTNDVQAGSYSVSRTTAAAPDFWHQHPYKGTFGPIDLTIPATVGSQHIRVETSANLAGNKGFDEVRVAFAEKYPPVGQPENVYIAVEPSTSTMDTIQYYFGERDPETNDTIFTELATDPASMIFTGSLYLAEVDLSNDVWEASVDAITITNFVGLNATNIDTLTAIVSHQWTSDVSNVTIASNVFTETDATSGIFRLTFTSPAQEMVVMDVENENGSDPGTYYPFLVRAQGPINMNDYVFDVEGWDLDLTEIDGYFYPRGGSTAPLVLARNEWQDNNIALIFYDVSASQVRSVAHAIDADVNVPLKTKANPAQTFGTPGGLVKVSLTTDMNNDGVMDDKDESLKGEGLGKIIWVNSSGGPVSGADALQEVQLSLSPSVNAGVAWIVYDTPKLRVWRDSAMTVSVPSGTKSSPNWNLASGGIPAALYVEGIAPSDGQYSSLVLKYAKGSEKAKSGAITFTVVDKLGHYAYFRGIRDFLAKQNRKIFVDETIDVPGGWSGPDFDLLAVRREKATLSVYDAKNNNKADVEAARDAAVIADPNVTIVANGTFFTEAKDANDFGLWTVGSVVMGGAEMPNLSKTLAYIESLHDLKEKGTRPECKGYFGQKSGTLPADRTITFKRNAEAAEASPIPNAALSGLIAYLPKAEAEEYDTVFNTTWHPTTRRHQACHVGYANENGEDILFILFTPGKGHYASEVQRGGADGLFAELVASGCSVCYGLDGGSSDGVVYKDSNGSWQRAAFGVRHWGIPNPWFSLVNNYIVISVAQ